MDWKPLVAILLVGLLLFGYTQYDSNQTAAAAAAASSPSVSQTSSASDAGAGALVGNTPDSAGPAVQEFTMSARQFEFAPSTLAVKKGVKVVIHLTTDDVAHGFALPDFNANVRIEPGQEATVEFTPDKAGTFTFFCNVPCGPGHRQMRGTLTVTE